MREIKIVYADDFTEPEEIRDSALEIGKYVDIVKTRKITPELVKGMKELLPKETKLWVDGKFADIGFRNSDKKWTGSNRKEIEPLFEAGADIVTVHALPSISGLDEAVSTADKYGKKVITLPYLTGKGGGFVSNLPLGRDQLKFQEEELKKYVREVRPRWEKKRLPQALNDLLKLKTEYCLWDGTPRLYESLIVSSEFCGVHGYVAPFNHPEILEKITEKTNKDVYTPGIGRQWQVEDEKEDIKRQMETVFSKVYKDKIYRGDMYIVSGSLIYKAENPKKAAEGLRKTADTVLKTLT